MKNVTFKNFEMFPSTSGEHKIRRLIYLIGCLAIIEIIGLVTSNHTLRLVMKVQPVKSEQE